MNPSRQPVLWVTSILGVLGALVTAGLIQQEDADRFGPLVTVGVPFLFLVISTGAGLITRGRTAPVQAGTEPVRALLRGQDGIYRDPLEHDKAARFGLWPNEEPTVPPFLPGRGGAPA